MSEPELFFGIVVPAAAALFAVPIGLAPIGWARAFRWPVAPAAGAGAHADERRLSVYFARCLSACVVAFGVASALAAWTGPIPPTLGLQAIVLGAGLALAHVVGAVERSQPRTEDLEIALYGGLTLWAVRVYSLLG